MSDLATIKGKAISVKTGLGALIGGAIGAVFGNLPGAAIGATIGGFAAHAPVRKRDGAMTAKRQIAFEDAMTTVGDPAKLRDLARTFEREGLHGHAARLKVRADLRELPEDVKAARRDVLRRAYSSDKADVIDELANAYEQCGALGVACDLHLHAKAVRAAHEAGKSAKPLDAAAIARFEAALVEAIKGFGPASPQAAVAASNLLRAGGKTPDDAGVAEMISRASAAGAPSAPPAEVAPPDAVNPTEPAATPSTIAKVGVE